MSAVLYGRDPTGVNRQFKKLYANIGGVNRELKELWAKDSGGVNREIYQYVPPITWTYATSDTFSYSTCTFSNSYTLKVNVLHTLNSGTAGVIGICEADYKFSSLISVASTDYLRVSSPIFSSNDPSDSIYLLVRAQQYGNSFKNLYDENQKVPNLQDGDKIQFGQDMSLAGISVIANMKLYGNGSDYYPHASIQLDLSVYITSQGIDSFWLGSQGHN